MRNPHGLGRDRTISRTYPTRNDIRIAATQQGGAHPKPKEGVQDQFVKTDLDTLVIALYVKIDDDAAGIARLPGRPPRCRIQS